MRDQIRDAYYTTPDHKALAWVSDRDGLHHCTEHDNPSFWHAVHQMAAVKHYSAGNPNNRIVALSQPRTIDITPAPVAVQNVEPAALTVPKVIYRNDPELERRLKEMEAYWQIEIAAEMAIIARAPEGAVDAGKRALALDVLGKEAAARSMSIDDLCLALGQSRLDRNIAIMQKRLEGIGPHG